MTKRNAGGARTLKVLGILNTIGDVLLLQLCFAIVSLGVVTVLPAAIALQRCLDDVLFTGDTAGVRSFARRFASAVKSYWLASIVVPVLAVMLVVGILFWAFAEGPIRLVALAVLLPLGGVFMGLYLSALAETVSTAEFPTARRLIGLAWLRMQRQPLHVAGSVVVMVTWFLLLLQVPTLVLVGSGVVPAFLAFWLRRGATPESMAARGRG